MEIGRRIYFEKTTGNVILDTGERSGHVVPTTVADDFASYVVLRERVPETIGHIDLEFGELTEDFAECDGYRVDVSADTPTLLFNYPDPDDKEPQEPVYRKPLSQEVDELQMEIADLWYVMMMGGA